MFSNLFSSKMEKELKTLSMGAPELELRYSGGDSITVSKMIKINRDSLVLLGFPGKLKKNKIAVKILANGARFETTILRQGLDNKGQIIFFCQMPEKIIPPSASARRLVINSQGSARVIVSTNYGEKSLTLPIWDISENGLSLLNTSKVQIKIGTKLFQSLLTVGTIKGHLADLQVANVRNHRNGKVNIPLLSCLFIHPPRTISEMLSMAKSLAPKPAPPK